MKTLKILALMLAAAMLLGVSQALAANTAPLTINATVSSRGTLTLSTGAISFADADPDSTPLITANPDPVTVDAKARTGSSSTVTLTVLASGDLVSGGDDIPITNVTWTATGTGFVAGTMDKGSAQTAGTWTGPAHRTGTFTYKLANNWNYKAGIYSASVLYTLSAP